MDDPTESCSESPPPSDDTCMKLVRPVVIIIKIINNNNNALIQLNLHLAYIEHIFGFLHRRQHVSSSSQVQLSVPVKTSSPSTTLSKPASRTCASAAATPATSACATPSRNIHASVCTPEESRASGGRSSSAVC